MSLRNSKYSVLIAAVFIASLNLTCSFSSSPEIEPAPVTDFSLVLGRTNSAHLSWKAPLIISGSEPVSYDLRYSTSLIQTSEDWNSADKVGGLPAPSLPETIETFTLEGLDPSKIYYAGLGVIGSNGQVSNKIRQVRIETADTSMPFAFTAPDLYGNIHSSTEWLGKRLVLVNFWGVWCVYCIKEIPGLIQVHNEFVDDGVVIVGINSGDRPGIALEFAEEKQLPWLNVEVPQEVGQSYGIRGYPTTIFLDSNGRELGRFNGMKTYDQFASAIRYVLNDTTLAPPQ